MNTLLQGLEYRMEEVLLELENDEDHQDMPMSDGSDDDFDDVLPCTTVV